MPPATPRASSQSIWAIPVNFLSTPASSEFQQSELSEVLYYPVGLTNTLSTKVRISDLVGAEEALPNFFLP